MAIRFKEIKATRVATDELVTASGEPANTGAHAITGTLSATGNFAINTNKFQVTAASGNTTVAGTLAVAGATTCSTTLAVTTNETVGGTLTVTGATALNGGVTCDTDKFVIADTTGATTIKGTLTIGVDDTGHDVKFFGATTGKYLLWDESADTLDVVGNTRTLGGLAMTGVDNAGVVTLFTNAAGDALLATGTAVPADAGAGYAKGCLFIDTDVGAGTSGLYCNIGTNASCNFNLITVAAD